MPRSWPSKLVWRSCNLYDVGTNSMAHYRLMELYKVKKRYEKAVEQGRSILAMNGVKRDLENEVRVELAICLDFLGRAEDAEMERMALADGGDDCALGFMGRRARGKALDKQQRFEEAAMAYEQALELNPPENKAGRDELLIRLVLASFNAGRPEETMKWVERAIQEGVADTRLYQAHRMAGFACSNLGRLDEAHHHRQRAYEMAVQQADTKKISDCLAGLADLHRLRGELDSAEALCLEAEALCPESARTAIVIHAIVMRARGRLEEALARMEHASRVGVMASSFSEPPDAGRAPDADGNIPGGTRAARRSLGQSQYGNRRGGHGCQARARLRSGMGVPAGAARRARGRGSSRELVLEGLDERLTDRVHATGLPRADRASHAGGRRNRVGAALLGAFSGDGAPAHFRTERPLSPGRMPVAVRGPGRRGEGISPGHRRGDRFASGQARGTEVACVLEGCRDRNSLNDGFSSGSMMKTNRRGGWFASALVIAAAWHQHGFAQGQPNRQAPTWC